MSRARTIHAFYAWLWAKSGLVTLGKTLILGSCPLFTRSGDVYMNNMFARIARFFPATQAFAAAPGVARSLLESAEADAGRNPHQAQQLRQAAYAYLSVVR